MLAPSSLPGQPQGAGVGPLGPTPSLTQEERVGRVGLHSPGKLIGQPFTHPLLCARHWGTGKKPGEFLV